MKPFEYAGSTVRSITLIVEDIFGYWSKSLCIEFYQGQPMVIHDTKDIAVLGKSISNYDKSLLNIFNTELNKEYDTCAEIVLYSN